jgi:hypothetical protein
MLLPYAAQLQMPVIGLEGEYHSIFRTPAGEERMLSIDQLLKYMGSWV